MSQTLSQILTDVNSYLDLTAELPTGDDLNVRANFAQQAVNEWGSAYRWRQLHSHTDVFVTGVTISLNSGFRELTSIPTGNGINYPEITYQDKLTKGASDQYSTVDGNSVTGYVLKVNGIPPSGVTLSFDWQRYPSNMATLTSICELPDPDFVKLKVISYVLQSRLDERFPVVDAEAKRILQNMIGREMVSVPGGFNSVPRYGAAAWAIGRRNG